MGNKLNFGINDRVHCETKEECLQFERILHNNGYKWCNGRSYIEFTKSEDCNFEDQKGIFYQPFDGTYDSYIWSVIETGGVVIPFKTFIDNHYCEKKIKDII